MSEVIYTKDEVKNMVVLEFKKLNNDVDFYRGFLMGALDDKCIELPEGWMEWPVEKLRDKAAEAHINAAIKILSGETLPSEFIQQKIGVIQ